MRKLFCTALVSLLILAFAVSCVSDTKHQQLESKPSQSQLDPQKGIGLIEIASKDASMPAFCEILIQGSQCSILEPAIELIKDKATLEQVWRRINTQGELPQVDFSKTLVVAIFMGIRNTGGYYYELGTIALKDGIWTIEVIESIPGMKEIVTMAITTPYILFTVPISKGDPVIISKQVMRK